jgi:outer membrane receptor protein involved in Fe transport
VAYTAELQQVWQTPQQSLVFGGRYQSGKVEAQTALVPISVPQLVPFPLVNQDFERELERANVYVYEHWQLADPFWLIGGLSYDWISYPDNVDQPPINDAQREADQLSPKAGFLWTPTTNTLMRGAYTRSLGGLYYDNSVRLEPTHVAGFNQAFRSLIPVSLGGLLAGADSETAGLDFSWRGAHGTYFGVGVEWLQSEGERTVGVFDSDAMFGTVTPSDTEQQVEFEEKSLTANLNQLVGRDWALGVRYRVSDTELSQRMPRVISDLSALNRQSRAPWAQLEDEGLLHQLECSARFAHPTGIFAEGQALWFVQDNEATPDEDFWQFNLLAGYRFAQRRAELAVGLLNVFDQDYGLNPVNYHPDLPRERTLLVRFQFNF